MVSPFGPSCRGRLKKYRRARQKFPLSLPLGPKDANTSTFDALATSCVDPKKKRAPGKAWISKGTWKLIATRASLLRSGKIRQAAARHINVKSRRHSRPIRLG